MKKHLLYFTILLFYEYSFAQDAVDFNPKVLYPELRRFSDNPESKILEMRMQSNDSNQNTGKYFTVAKKSGAELIQFIYMGRVNSCRAGGCTVNRESGEDSDHEYFDYFIFFDSIPSVRLVKVYNYQASHGQEVTAKGWLRQFVGYDGNENLQVGKQIDAISGATISVWGITIDVQKRLGDLNGLLKPSLPVVNN